MAPGSRRLVSGALLGFVTLGVAAYSARAQHPGHGATPPAVTATPAAPRKVTMEELHRAGGVPRGWKFALPAGDPVKGRQLFADLECYKCHAIQGESFPKTGGDPKNVGPELTGMGGQHPAEYFAESILSPNAVLLDGPGYTGPDGTSIMPSYADSLSVTQLVDLVAFLKGLTVGGTRMVRRRRRRRPATTRCGSSTRPATATGTAATPGTARRPPRPGT